MDRLSKYSRISGRSIHPIQSLEPSQRYTPNRGKAKDHYPAVSSNTASESSQPTPRTHIKPPSRNGVIGVSQTGVIDCIVVSDGQALLDMHCNERCHIRGFVGGSWTVGRSTGRGWVWDVAPSTLRISLDTIKAISTCGCGKAGIGESEE
jgi:hypothetical protein